MVPASSSCPPAHNGSSFFIMSTRPQRFQLLHHVHPPTKIPASSCPPAPEKPNFTMLMENPTSSCSWKPQLYHAHGKPSFTCPQKIQLHHVHEKPSFFMSTLP
jgi:hypothetical protein